jgi:hypothetical protein
MSYCSGMNCPGDHQTQQNHTAGFLRTPNLSALTEMHGHVNHLWLLGSVSDTSTHTVLGFMGCERNGVQYSHSATLPCALGCRARCIFFFKGVGSGDLLGRRLGNHLLPTSLPSNTNWCFSCSPYPCWIPAMHCGLDFGNIPKHTVWKGSGYIYTCLECPPSVKPWLARSVPYKLTYATAEYAT